MWVVKYDILTNIQTDRHTEIMKTEDPHIAGTFRSLSGRGPIVNCLHKTPILCLRSKQYFDKHLIGRKHITNVYPYIFYR